MQDDGRYTHKTLLRRVRAQPRWRQKKCQIPYGTCAKVCWQINAPSMCRVWCEKWLSSRLIDGLHASDCALRSEHTIATAESGNLEDYEI